MCNDDGNNDAKYKYQRLWFSPARKDIMLTLRINREERQVLAGEARQVWGEAQSEAGGHLKDNVMMVGRGGGGDETVT